MKLSSHEHCYQHAISSALLKPATQPGGLGASRETPDHWTADAVRYLPKCLYFQANPQRARLAMTGFLPCSILAEKAKLLKTKEL
jgi:hypothetical protein